MKDRIIYTFGVALVLAIAVLLPIAIADTNTTVSNQDSISYPPKIDKIQGLLWTEILKELSDGKLTVTAQEIGTLSVHTTRTRILINLKVDLLNETEREPVLADIGDYGASNIEVYKYVNTIGADFPIDKLDELASSDYVESILDADAQIFETKLDDSVPAVKANHTYSLGLTGSGVRVAVLDTGINHTTNLITIARGNNGQLLQLNAMNDLTTDVATEDHDGHGTHVAGIIAAHRHQYNGRWLQGVAPGAEIVPVRVFDGNDPQSGTMETIVNGIDWAVGQSVDIIHMSLGSALPENYPNYWVDTWLVTDRTEEMAAVRDATDQGVTVVISSGNNAANHASGQLNQGDSREIHFEPTSGNVSVDFYTQTKEGSFTIRVLDPNNNIVSQHNYIDGDDNYKIKFPIVTFQQLNQQWTLNVTRNQGSGGDGRYNIIVGKQEEHDNVDIVQADRDPFHTVTIPGNVEKAITVGAVKDNGDMTDFSSRGPLRDGGIKPDLVAPGGEWIISLYPGGHAGMAGTSQAAPHVSGAAAVLIQFYREQYNRELTPAEIKALLMGSAVDSNGDLKGTIDNEYGAGILNVYAGYISSIAHDTVGGLILPDDDDDCNARVPINAPAWLKVKGLLYWEDIDDDIDLSLFNPSGNQVDSDDQSPPRITRIVSSTPIDGVWRYYINGKSYGGTFDVSENWYLGTPYPPSDAYKETTGIIHECVVTKHDIEVPSNAEYLRSIVYWNDVSSNMDIELYDPNNNLVDYSNLTGVSVEQVGIHSPVAGKWRLEINGTSITGAQDYSILSNYEAKEDPIEKGLRYLRTTQQGTPNPSDGDGSWSSDVGVTSLAALCFLNAGYDETDPDVQDAIGYIRSKVQGDGSIWSYSDRKTYHTSLATLALVATHNASYGVTINNAAQWLNDSQWDEDCLWGKVNNDSWYYGGFGYGTHTRPDLSNTQFALMALDAVQDISKDDLLWDKAQVFLARVQNRQQNVDIPDLDYTVEWNPTYNTYDDGGFVYYPGYSLAGNMKSYGSITGAGIWGLRLSGVEKNDPRVEAAVNWVIDNYMWDGNPGMSNLGSAQYYYYLSMSKALTMIEHDIGGHDWYQDLSNNLTALQKPEGYWTNERDSWLWENNKDLATSYSILSLQTRAELPPSVKRLSYLTFILHSPVDLHIYDPLGRHVGMNYTTGEMEVQIPNATCNTSADLHNITVPNLEAGDYRLVLIGTGTGNYTLDVIGRVGDTVVSEDSYTANITDGEVHDATVTVAMITGLSIHVTDAPEPTLQTNLTDVSLASLDPGITKVCVSSLNLSAINETYKPARLTPQSAYMVNSTGTGSFTLRVANVSNANAIAAYKINVTNHWIPLDTTTTTDTVTFTMDAGDPPVVVFCSGAIQISVDLYTGWNMISLPLRPDSPSAASVLSTIPNAGSIAYAWNASEGSYDAVYGDMELELGRAYWISLTSDGTWTPDGTEVHGIKVNLTPSWNMISVPCAADVSATDITVTAGTDACNLADAANNGYIGGIFYSWDAANGVWDATVIYDTAVLKPGIGYFANLNQECIITYP